MIEALVKQLIKCQRNMNEEQYLTSTILYSIAPTLQKRKPSSLVTFTKNNRNLYVLWDKYKSSVCKELNIECFEVRRSECSVLVLFYNPIQLRAFLKASKNKYFLKDKGYNNLLELEDYLKLLKKRFAKGCPHEIGIFLGIPVEDVIGFIESKGKECLLCKYWKVYSNPERAKVLFGLYDEAKILMIQRYLENETNQTMPILQRCS